MISSSYMKLVLLGFKHGLEVSRVRGGIQGKRSFQTVWGSCAVLSINSWEAKVIDPSRQRLYLPLSPTNEQHPAELSQCIF